ncbi:hypothetical protein [Streptomyces syringium]|uniref:hypothetical protein n=1 Tax=Streptomyces syringium TaxID=76729 RepID=UPI0034566CAC
MITVHMSPDIQEVMGGPLAVEQDHQEAAERGQHLLYEGELRQGERGGNGRRRAPGPSVVSLLHTFGGDGAHDRRADPWAACG